MVIGQVMTMVMEMIQSGASEEQVSQAALIADGTRRRRYSASDDDGR
jgi:hypothetical protein